MSFNTLKKEQLIAVLNGFGEDVPEKVTVPQLKEAIDNADYITFEDALPILKDAGLWSEEDAAKYEKATEEAKADAKAKKDAEPKDTVIKMYRANRSYEIMGHKFTQENPYALMTAADAEAITDIDPEGFRYASPKEVAEFYG